MKAVLKLGLILLTFSLISSGLGVAFIQPVLAAGPVKHIFVNSLQDNPDANTADKICADSSGKCTLRAALQNTVAAGTINYINVDVEGTFTLSNSLPAVRNSVWIIGTGYQKTFIKMASDIDKRIFSIRKSLTSDKVGSLTLSGVTLSGGRDLAGNCGGAIWVEGGGYLQLWGVVIRDSYSASNGGAVCLAGSAASGVDPIDLEVAHSGFISNTAAGNGGAIYRQNNGYVEIDRTSFYNNKAVNGGAIALENNEKHGYDKITNTTFAKNSAAEHGGAYYGSLSSAGAGDELRLNNVTIAENTADSDANGSGNGGGVFAKNLQVEMHNTILAKNLDNSPSLKHPNCSSNQPISFDSGVTDKRAYNLTPAFQGCEYARNNDKTNITANVDPGLVLKQAQRAASYYYDLLPGSPAVNNGNPLSSNSVVCKQYDQLDLERPLRGRCDIGAVESDYVTELPIYRFWSEVYQRHFYTISEPEKRQIEEKDPNWKFENIVFQAFPKEECNDGRTPVYRFWSSLYRGHFYTIDAKEKDALIAGNPNWTYEGTAYCANNTDQGARTVPMYRFWSAKNNAHFYTISQAEYESLLTNPEWQFEKIAFYVYEFYQF